LEADTSRLSPGDREALAKLVSAARLLNPLFMEQLWAGNHALHEELKNDTSELGRARLECFEFNKGPWSSLDNHASFIPGTPARKPPGANFYPPDLTPEEFTAWADSLPEADREAARGFFTVIRRGPDKRLQANPYSEEYRAYLEPAAALLREAATATGNESLKKFLSLRADAFLSNDYYASDVAWMELDAPLEITIGPYETYNDELFGFKAAFEAYIAIRDDAETARLKFFADHMQEIEDNLPIDPCYRNPKIGANVPIRVVNEVLASGDGSHGVRTAAFNLPNDERIVHEKGTKQVMLRNIQQAKFDKVLRPIAARVLAPAAQSDVTFDSFFTHILAHELSHGIGPHRIEVNGRSTSVRGELKETYSAIEEAKADITALFLLQYLFDRGLLPCSPAIERQLYTTFLASSFRSMRFGLNEAHGKGMAIQVNYLTEHGGFVVNGDGTFAVDLSKIKTAVTGLARDILTIEAEGNYAAARRMLDMLGVMRPELQSALDRLTGIPVDIYPVNER
jgi:hypothetical protein